MFLNSLGYMYRAQDSYHRVLVVIATNPTTAPITYPTTALPVIPSPLPTVLPSVAPSTPPSVSTVVSSIAGDGGVMSWGSSDSGNGGEPWCVSVEEWLGVRQQRCCVSKCY